MVLVYELFSSFFPGNCHPRLRQVLPTGVGPEGLLAILLMIGGLQLGSLGLVGELITRLYYELRARPIYAIREVLIEDRGSLPDG